MLGASRALLLISCCSVLSILLWFMKPSSKQEGREERANGLEPQHTKTAKKDKTCTHTTSKSSRTSRRSSRAAEQPSISYSSSPETANRTRFCSARSHPVGCCALFADLWCPPSLVSSRFPLPTGTISKHFADGKEHKTSSRKEHETAQPISAAQPGQPAARNAAEHREAKRTPALRQ